MRILGILLALLVGVSGCNKRPDTLATARVYTPAEITREIGFTFAGDPAYAEVASAALPQLYADFRAGIFRKGVTKWDERFDCNHFASYFAALAQTKFYLANFHSFTPAKSLAVGTIWYHSPRGAHAIVVALTERGTVFLEPQTGHEVTLTKAETDSVYYRAF